MGDRSYVPTAPFIGRVGKSSLFSFYSTMEDAEAEIGTRPVLNKLALLVKEKETQGGIVRKARGILDLREGE